MAKMQSGTGLRKIALSQIIDTGNVRTDYRDIEGLAESIKKNGQLEPVLVKAPSRDADGIERYELVAGHRRLRALQSLMDAGESFTNIDAVVITGDKLTIQLVENLQRSDLTAPERESGIYEMCRGGLSQKEVAAQLSKPEAYISRNVCAFKVREAAQAAGVDASSLATGTLNEIQAAAAADYPALVSEILRNGGTLDAARLVMENYRVAHGKPARPKAAKAAASAEPPPGPESTERETGALSDPLGIAGDSLDPVAGMENEAPPEMPGAPPPAVKAAPKPAKEKAPSEPRSWVDDFDPPHKQVDFNEICLAIMGYARESEKVVKACTLGECETCAERCLYFYKLETVQDIMALLHMGL
jgi:ParB/RepB/Spo0J family partition protein